MQEHPSGGSAFIASMKKRIVRERRPIFQHCSYAKKCETKYKQKCSRVPHEKCKYVDICVEKPHQKCKTSYNKQCKKVRKSTFSNASFQKKRKKTCAVVTTTPIFSPFIPLPVLKSTLQKCQVTSRIIWATLESLYCHLFKLGNINTYVSRRKKFVACTLWLL